MASPLACPVVSCGCGAVVLLLCPSPPPLWCCGLWLLLLLLLSAKDFHRHTVPFSCDSIRWHGFLESSFVLSYAAERVINAFFSLKLFPIDLHGFLMVFAISFMISIAAAMLLLCCSSIFSRNDCLRCLLQILLLCC